MLNRATVQENSCPAAKCATHPVLNRATVQENSCPAAKCATQNAEHTRNQGWHQLKGRGHSGCGL